MKRNLVLIILVLTQTALWNIAALDRSEIRSLLTSVTVRVDVMFDPESVDSFGSGFFVSEDGLVLTNFHVVEQSVRYGHSIRVMLSDGSFYEGGIVHWNAHRDWAVLQIDTGWDNVPYLEFAGKVDILDEIWTAGYPLTGNLKIMEGTISSFQPECYAGGLHYYDVSVTFDHGNSGGPVINSHGEAVGIVTAYDAAARGFDYIIPIQDVKEDIYWLRYLTDSEAYVPSNITGEDEVAYLGDFFRVTNRTGYDIWYLYVIDEQMLDDGEYGEDLLGMRILFDREYIDVFALEYDWLVDPLYVDYGKTLYVVAFDIDDDMYLLEWSPDFDPWEITIRFDDIIW